MRLFVKFGKNMRLDSILYQFFGTSIIISSSIKKQLDFLKEKLPNDFKNRNELFDLGCGDGRITLKLKDIFKPKNIKGCDVHPSLVEMAKKRGIDAKVIDLENELPKGDLGVMWGVLHHLKNQDDVLASLKKNFQMLVLREPLKVKNKLTSFLELGKPFQKEEAKKLFLRVLGNQTQLIEYQNAIFVFWKK